MTQRVLEWIGSRLNMGLRVASATVLSASGSVPGKPGARLALTSKNDRCGTVGGAGLEMTIISRLQELLTTSTVGGEVITFGLNKGAKGYEVTPLDSLCGGRLTVSLEVIEPTPHILLMGGGHVAAAIASISHGMGWDHSVHDTREEYAGELAYPNARELHAGSVKSFFADEDFSSLSRFSDILLLGHDWKEDEERLQSLLELSDEMPHPARIGVIGSRSKWQSFSKTCLDNGISQSSIEQVTCPIGIALGAETPAEIAISVIAEIIASSKGVDPTQGTWRQSI
ncbi:MAG: XdhC/CoxI family protein [Candidatus Poseidoniaceae archaeon]|jgi:xanthine dehydrogenase accessory factor|nr:XdhC/CoxI family protein [Candidatus Poseidoniaceae archaeon]MDP7001917.1 XdhC/CoxI family protein [Candidatus Poseidoniaceae archaeon]